MDADINISAVIRVQVGFEVDVLLVLPPAQRSVMEGLGVGRDLLLAGQFLHEPPEEFGYRGHSDYSQCVH